MNKLKIYLGWDSREAIAYDVARQSILRRASAPKLVQIIPLELKHLGHILTRPIEQRDGKMWCPISQAPMSTEFAISRFCVPFLQKDGWALFADSDIVCLADIADLFTLVDDKYAVMVVKHPASDTGLRVGYDERCEIISNVTQKEEYRLWPILNRDDEEENKRRRHDSSILELLIQGRHYGGDTSLASPTPWTCNCHKTNPYLFIIQSAQGEELFTVAANVQEANPDREAALLKLKGLIERDPWKMNRQLQTTYSRKNWSSVVLWNCSHPAHRELGLGPLNTWPGRDLHAFKWLKDEEIGELPAEWNYLVDVNPTTSRSWAKLLHFTLGGPWLKDWKGGSWDQVWLDERRLTL